MPSSYAAPVHNAYGRVTNIVNNDPSEFVSRAHSFCGAKAAVPLPGCYELKGCLQATNLVDFHSCAEDELHGNLHSVLGGLWECPYGLGDALEEWGANSTAHTKMLLGLGCRGKDIWNKMWAHKFMECPTSCNASTTPYAECNCACYGFDADGDDALALRDVRSIFDTVGMTEFIRTDYRYTDSGGKWHVHGLSGQDEEAFFRWLLKFACHAGKMGSMATGASANDPLFWPLHPVFDRAWMYLRLAPEFATFNHTWPGGSTCYGHNWHDLLNFRDLFTTNHDGDQAASSARPRARARRRATAADAAADPAAAAAEPDGRGGAAAPSATAAAAPSAAPSAAAGDAADAADAAGAADDDVADADADDDAAGASERSHFYSNAELYTLFDPSNPVLPYVYETFAWQHCETDPFEGHSSHSSTGRHGLLRARR